MFFLSGVLLELVNLISQQMDQFRCRPAVAQIAKGQCFMSRDTIGIQEQHAFARKEN